MASDTTTTADTALIEQIFKLQAPGIHNISCGKKLDGSFQVLFQLEPSSMIRFLDITEAEYSDLDTLKEKILAALEDANV